MSKYRGRHRAATVGISTGAAVALAGGVIAAAPAAFAGDGVPDRWEAVVECESGGDPNAVNPNSGAAGLYQFMPGTWDAHKPAGYPDHPTEATPQQQLVVAERVLAAQGPGAWVCPGAPGSASDPSPTPEPEPAPAPEPDPEPAEAEQPDPEPVSDTSSGSPAVDPVYPADNYRIKSGDTLGVIASQYDTSVAALEQANPRTVENVDLIFPGEGLFIATK